VGNEGYKGFRLQVTKGFRCAVGDTYTFKDGTRGQIRKIQSVETNAVGHVFVNGYYVEVAKR
jgi:hypothetical protein